MDRKIIIGEKPIRIKESETGDFLSLTDLAKLVNDDSSKVISKWIEMLKTIDFLDVWERNYNPNYDRSGYDEIRQRAGVPSFFLSTKQWIKKTGAIGIETKSGRNGGTFAHHLIALEFCSTMNPEFRFRVFKEYTELKQNEAMNWLKTYEFFLEKIEDNSLENNRYAQDLKQSMKKLKGKS